MFAYEFTVRTEGCDGPTYATWLEKGETRAECAQNISRMLAKGGLGSVAVDPHTHSVAVSTLRYEGWGPGVGLN